MIFEWDNDKSYKNKCKHGIDFTTAEKIWLSDPIQIGPLPVHRESSIPEYRFLAIGVISGVHWTAIITYRGVRIRIISCRRSRKDEVRLYEKNS